MSKKIRRHPDWLKVSIPGGASYQSIKKQLRSAHLHTICEEAKCPNLSECFHKGTATFLILGDKCTRDCRYCNVTHGTPEGLNEQEPNDVAESVKSLGLSHVVITSVTRDDLSDGGASVFADTIHAVRASIPSCTVEVLIPDFQGNKQALYCVLDAKPDVLNHNIEVVQDLFPSIRPQGYYQQSIDLLTHSKQYDPSVITKSGFMVGLGENRDQINHLFNDLRTASVDIITIGQYLQPTRAHVPIERYYSPEEFDELASYASKDLGFVHVESGPLVRSSYHAEQALRQVKSTMN